MSRFYKENKDDEIHIMYIGSIFYGEQNKITVAEKRSSETIRFIWLVSFIKVTEAYLVVLSSYLLFIGLNADIINDSKNITVQDSDQQDNKDNDDIKQSTEKLFQFISTSNKDTTISDFYNDMKQILNIDNILIQDYVM